MRSGIIAEKFSVHRDVRTGDETGGLFRGEKKHAPFEIAGLSSRPIGVREGGVTRPQAGPPPLLAEIDVEALENAFVVADDEYPLSVSHGGCFPESAAARPLL